MSFSQLVAIGRDCIDASGFQRFSSMTRQAPFELISALLEWRSNDGVTPPGMHREKSMIARFKLGIAIPQTNAPILETERLILRRWQEADIEPNTEMLADPVSARFITSDRKPVTDAFFGWRNAAIMAGHWALHGFGM